MKSPARGRRFVKGVTVTALFAVVLTVILTVRTARSPQDSLVNHKALGNSFAGKISRRLLQDDVECREVHQVEGQDEKCQFINETEDCDKEEGYPWLDYNSFVYCDIGHAVWGAMIVLIIWWLWLFVGLAVCADDFFCPSLVVISDTLRLSPNVAGVTFLAFGNGAPDLFSAIAALGGSDDPEMGVSGLFGAGTFVTTVVVGTIAVIKPFKAMERPFLRDVIFYMFLVYWVFAILWRGKIFLWETIGFIVYYCLYVVVVVISGSLYKKMKANEAGKDPTEQNIDLSNATFKKTEKPPSLYEGLDPTEKEPAPVYDKVKPGSEYEEVKPSNDVKADGGEVNKAFEGDGDGKPNVERKLSIELDGAPDNLADISGVLELSTMDGIGNLEPNGLHNVDKGSDAGSADSDGELPSPWLLLLQGLNPIDTDEFMDMPWYLKFYEIFKCPLVFIITLTCPVVNYEVAGTHNWNRYLQILQCVIAPTGCLCLLQFPDAMIGDVFPVAALTLIIGIAIGALVFFTSENYKKPVYHWAFGYAEFLIAIIWIYVIANEIVALLQTFGIVFNISDAILGLTLLAWGNSIGDWIADSLMARQGFARMGFAACYGAPVFNLSLGLGIPYVIQMATENETEIRMRITPVLLVLSIFLLGSLVSSLLILPLTKFKVHKGYGIYLMSYYVAFLVIALLTETGVLLGGWNNLIYP